MKNENICVCFLYIKYSKFWSVSLEHFVERKPLISEEWLAHLPIGAVVVVEVVVVEVVVVEVVVVEVVVVEVVVVEVDVVVLVVVGGVVVMHWSWRWQWL